MDVFTPEESALFRGISRPETEALLRCLGAERRK